MSAAHKRMAELLDRWLASVDLHTKYLDLTDTDYAKAQEWPRHQRPTKWVVQLARTRLEDLRKRVAARADHGDDDFAESLELMSFLTNLLGSEHIERFIPLATSKSNTAASGTVKRPRIKASDTARSATKAAAPAAARTDAGHRAPPAPKASSKPAHAADKIAATVVADAVRFLAWGREWPALAPLIARLADRPSEAEVLKILRANREAIERRVHARKK
jgi:hypothetical protein